jgi:hypothetical protein
MRSMRMWTLTPRRAASARARSSWWRAPSTSTTQVRWWVGSRCSAWSKTAAMTCSLGWVTEPVSHFACALGPILTPLANCGSGCEGEFQA